MFSGFLNFSTKEKFLFTSRMTNWSNINEGNCYGSAKFSPAL